MDYKEIISRAKLHPSRVKNIYAYGSRVYGNITKESDYDFVIIGNNSVPSQEIRSGNFNIHLLTMDHFKSLLVEHKPMAIECYYLPDEFRYLESGKLDFKLNLKSLRHSFCHVSSNSWVKAKKKMEQGDYYLGVKSLFHSLRIPMFGTQIGKYEDILDYSCANFIHEKIFSEKWSWNDLDNEFRSLRNKILTEFREVSPK